MTTSRLRWLLAGFTALCCMAVFGAWKIGELVYERLPAGARHAVARTRAAVIDETGLAPLVMTRPEQPVEPGFQWARYGVYLRLTDSQRFANQPRRPGVILRDYYRNAYGSTETLPESQVWKTFWSLNGGETSRRDDSGEHLRIVCDEPDVVLQSMPFALQAGQRPALRLRGRAGQATPLQIDALLFEGPVIAETWALELNPGWHEFVLLGPPTEAPRDGAFRLNFPAECELEFAQLLPGVDLFNPCPSPYFPHYVEFRLNSRADRDFEYPEPPAEGAVRMICLGDSFTEGTGVRMEESYPKQLEVLLRERGHGPIEVRNCGIAGADLWDYAERFAARDLELAPQVVVVALCRNDYETPVRQATVYPTMAEKAQADHEYCLEHGFQEAFTQLEEIAQLCRERDIELVVCAYQIDNNLEHFRLDQDAREFAEERGLTYYNPAQDLIAAELYDEKAVCDVCEGHPNPRTHGEFAARLADLLEERGILSRAHAKAGAPSSAGALTSRDAAASPENDPASSR